MSFDGSNGYYPNGSLIEGSDGNFYGMTSSGGAYGYGTAFKMTPEGALTTLVDFDYYTNGYGPNGSLIQGSDGDFYGMTNSGGPSGYGTAFKMTSDGTLTILVSFDYSNGYGPYRGSLIQASDGNFYGMTGGWLSWQRDRLQNDAGRNAHDAGGFRLFKRLQSAGQPDAGERRKFIRHDAIWRLLWLRRVFRLTLDGAITVLDSFDYYTTAIILTAV